LTVDNLPTQEFGSKDALFSSKKNARHNAARCAVQHYKKKGIWPDDSTDVGGIKKRKTGAQPAALPTPSPISLGACISGAMSAKDGESYASQVVKLAIALDLGAPEWRYTEQSAEQFHTVGCFFNARGRHHGPFGEARNVFGKKAAKEACARKTLASLQKVRDERLGLRRPATASSSDSGAGGSSPQQFEDEVGGGGIAIGLGAGLDIDPEDSFDEDEYDDAMEELKGDV
jgi:hypothetical protein